MADIEKFITGLKTKVIAPAGHGKTHFIADCVKYAYEHNMGKQLVLTHTHAGVASIKSKLLKQGIRPSAYNVETICGYAQKYVLGFMADKALEQKTTGFQNVVIDKATELFSKRAIIEIIKKTYTGIFIDEYQDCTLKQHNMLMKLKDFIPIHVLGDPLQGIFEFREPMVEFDRDLYDFSDVAGTLETPWRWETNGNNHELGESIKELRRYIETNAAIDLSINKPGISFIQSSNDIYRDSLYRSRLLTLANAHDNILIIDNGRIKQRQKLRNSLGLQHFQLIEAIDDSDFYTISSKLDELCTSESQFLLFKEICETFLFNTTDINKWFNLTGLKSKRHPSDIEKCNLLKPHIEKLQNNCMDKQSLHYIIKFMKDELELKYQRPELVMAIIKAVKDAAISNVSICDSMYTYKNKIRQAGRNLHSKCIGSTLLTKGLEFDNVIVLDAQAMDCKNFYVAISRACKTLTICSSARTLTFVA